MLAGCHWLFPLEDSTATGDAADDGPVDRDNDGVDNDVDVCPDASDPEQADEDDDDLGDVCDPCPISPVNDDGDNDGVGDACDPNPQVVGDAIVMFDGFETDIPDGWLHEGGWTVEGGYAEVAAAPGTEAYLGPSIDARRNGTVSARFTGSVRDNATGIGVGHTLSTSGLPGLACQVYTNMGGGEAFGYIKTDDSVVQSSIPANWDLGVTYTLASQRQDGFSTCTLLDQPDTTMVVTDFMSSGMLAAARVKGMTGRFEWILFVSSP